MDIAINQINDSLNSDPTQVGYKNFMPNMIIARNKGETNMLGQELIGKNESK